MDKSSGYHIQSGQNQVPQPPTTSFLAYFCGFCNFLPDYFWPKRTLICRVILTPTEKDYAWSIFEMNVQDLDFNNIGAPAAL